MHYDQKITLHESNRALNFLISTLIAKQYLGLVECPSNADSTCQVWPFGWFTLSVKPVWTGEIHSELHTREDLFVNSCSHVQSIHTSI